MFNLKNIDKENNEFFDEVKAKVHLGEYSLKDILGFELKEPAVYVSRALCGHFDPSFAAQCKLMKSIDIPLASLWTLLPVYNQILYPISSKATENNFQKINGISLKDFIRIIEHGKIIPYFKTAYQNYDSNLMEQFIKTGIPRISSTHHSLVKEQGICKLFNSDCKKCGNIIKSARKDIIEFTQKSPNCYQCLALAYSAGIRKEELLESQLKLQSICAVTEILSSRNFGTVYQANCPINAQALKLFRGHLSVEDIIEPIVCGLKIKYSPDLDLNSYLDLLDGKTTRAVREAISRILKEPFTAKYSERLNSKIFEYNREVEEISKTRTAKFYHAVSNIAVYGGSKFIERQSEGYLQAKKEDTKKTSEWLASKFMDYHAKIMKKDWTYAHLYRFRCKMNLCKVENPLKAG